MSKAKGLRINEAIKVSQVRLVDHDDNQVGIVDAYVALERARGVNLDLVEVAPNGEPPVCKIMDYGKWLYEQKRKYRESRKKSHQHTATLKEIRLRPETDKHDLEIKMKKAHAFLEKGHKVQFTMFFRGRQMLHQDKGLAVLDGIVEQMEDIAKIDRPAKMAHRRMTLLLIPK